MNWKNYLLTKLRIIILLLALVGWFMVVAITLEMGFGQDLTWMEDTLESSAFIWGMRIFVIVLLVVMRKYSSKIDETLENNGTLRNILRVYLVGGLVGWVVGIASLVA